MTQADKLLVVTALVLGVLDFLNAKGPFTRFSPAGLAIILLAVVQLHRGGVISY